MKKLYYLLSGLLLFLGVYTQAQNINWLSLNEALELQKTAPKKIIVDVYANWCGPCKMLDKNTFQNEDVANYINANFYAVKFNGEGDSEVTFKGKTYNNPDYDEKKKNSRNSAHDFTRALGISAYPTIIYFDEKGEIIAPVPGYQSPQGLEMYLKLFNTDAHKNITSQEEFNEYYENFEPEFKS